MSNTQKLIGMTSDSTKFFPRDKEFRLYLLMWLIPVCLLMLMYVTSVVTMYVGWGTLLGRRMIEGMVPYKDFEYPVPPITLLYSYAYYKLFGNAFIGHAIIGSFLRIFIYFLLYRLFYFIYRPFYAACGTIVTALIVVSWIMDAGAFNWSDIGFATGLGIAIIFCIMTYEFNITKKNNYSHMILIGLLCAISVLNKQTFGLPTFFLSGFSIIFLTTKMKNFKASIAPFGVFLCAFFSILLIFVFFLMYNDAVSAFVNQNFFGAIAAKTSTGGLRQLIFHHFKVIGNPDYTFYIYLFSFAFLFMLAGQNATVKETKISSDQQIIIFIAFAILTIIIAFLFVEYYPRMRLAKISKLYWWQIKIGAFAMFFVTIGAWIFFCKVLFEKKINEKLMIQYVIFAFIFMLSYGCSGSLASPNSSVMNYGLMVAFALNIKFRFFTAKNLCIIAFILYTIFTSSVIKIYAPCFWNSWRSPSLLENRFLVRSINALKGYRLTLEEINIFESSNALVNEFTTPSDTILAYNNIPSLYEIVDRRPAITTVTHYWDLCPDDVAENDALLIQAIRPKIIFYMRYSDSERAIQEYTFRHGKLSGQRKIDKAIQEMTVNGAYIPIKAFYHKDLLESYARGSFIDSLSNHANDSRMYPVLPVEKVSCFPDNFILYILVRRDVIIDNINSPLLKNVSQAYLDARIYPEDDLNIKDDGMIHPGLI